MKYIKFYLFNIFAFMPLGICLIMFTAIMGMTLGASGGGFGVAIVLLSVIYLFINFKWSKKLPYRWIHFFCGIFVGISSLALIRFII
jgi:hypothetical protein